MQGHKDLLGIWLSESEGAKFWLSVLDDLHSRGVNDILINCVDGIEGFPEAINIEYPEALMQLRIVHTVRNSMKLFDPLQRLQGRRSEVNLSKRHRARG